MQVYADNAATAKMRPAALQTYISTAKEYYGNPSSLHEAGQAAKEVLEESRARIANMIGAEAREIIFTSGGSEADNQAIFSAAMFGAKKGKKKIVSTAIEHHAVLHALDRLKSEGFEIVLAPVDPNGIVNTAALEQAIDENTCLVSVMLANNEIGTIQPVREIGAICKSKGVLFHTDAVQAVGHVNIDIPSLNIDMLSLSAHKFHGPKGVGALYVRTGVALTNLIDGGAQERGKRAGTENIPAIVGMAAALKECAAKIDATAKKLVPLRERLIDGLLGIPHTALNGDRTERLPNNVNVCFEGIEGESLLLMLDCCGVYASSGSACTSGSLDPSHVLLAIGRPHDVAHGSLRLTFAEDATAEQIDYIIEQTEKVVAYLRNMSPVWKDLTEGKKNYVIQ